MVGRYTDSRSPVGRCTREREKVEEMRGEEGEAAVPRPPRVLKFGGSSICIHSFWLFGELAPGP
jgi:hypothetical protein